MDRGQLDQVKDLYSAILQKEASVNGLVKRMTIEVEEDQNRSAKRENILSRREEEKLAIREKLGDAKYQELYECLIQHRRNDETNEREMYAEIKQRIGGSKE